MDDHLKVTIGGNDHAVLLTLRGELDIASSPDLEAALEQVSGWGTELVVLDLTQLKFMDSTGHRVLVNAQQSAEDGGPRLEVITGSRQVRRLLRMTGADRCLTLIDTPANR